MEHVPENRLREAAEKDLRLLAPELDHVEKCEDCLTTFSKIILQVARESAQTKAKPKIVRRILHRHPRLGSEADG
jgi:hypothetical protein